MPAQGCSESLFRKAHTLFATVEEETGYLEDRNLDDAQVDLLIHHEKKPMRLKFICLGKTLFRGLQTAFCRA